MQPAIILDKETRDANEHRKSLRAEIALDVAQLDQMASELYVELGTWAEVADAMHYANGAIARRAALRHKAKTEQLEAL